MVSIAHEPDNPRDRWALLVSGATAGAPALGHLPADVAKWLAPLLTGGFVVLGGVIMEDSVSGKAPVLMSIKVRSSQPTGRSKASSCSKHIFRCKLQTFRSCNLSACMLQCFNLA